MKAAKMVFYDLKLGGPIGHRFQGNVRLVGRRDTKRYMDSVGWNYEGPRDVMEMKEVLGAEVAVYQKHFPKSSKTPAMIGKENREGGIDFTANKTALEVQNAGESIKFHLNLFGHNYTNSKQLGLLLKQLQNAPGFVPVIISIQPLTDLRRFLGIIGPVGVDKSA